MSMSTIYIPIQIWVGKGLKRTSYELFKQIGVGNYAEARKRKTAMIKEYPPPKYLVRVKQGYISIYKK